MDHLQNLEAWRALVAVSDSHSISAAAQTLNMEISTVSRLIGGIEKTLGRNLINRNVRPIAVLDSGKNVIDSIRPILKAHDEFLAQIRNDLSLMEGHIRLALESGLMRTSIADLLIEFNNIYPGINFELQHGKSIDACIAGEVDIASISITPTRSDLVVLPRGRTLYIPVASPEYIKQHGAPVTPEDLANHMGFVYSGPVRGNTDQLVRGKDVRPISWKSFMTSSDTFMIKNAVMNGLGVTVDVPLVHCYREIDQGLLVPILSGWHREPSANHVICTIDGWRTRRIRVFMNWYAQKCRALFGEAERQTISKLGQAVFDTYC